MRVTIAAIAVTEDHCSDVRLVVLPRVFEYPIKFLRTRVLVTFCFRLQISISGCSFLQSVDELTESMETRGLSDFISPLARQLSLPSLRSGEMSSDPCNPWIYHEGGDH